MKTIETLLVRGLMLAITGPSLTVIALEALKERSLCRYITDVNAFRKHFVRVWTNKEPTT